MGLTGFWRVEDHDEFAHKGCLGLLSYLLRGTKRRLNGTNALVFLKYIGCQAYYDNKEID